MSRYQAKPVKVVAIQVKRPYKDVTNLFPRSHMVKLPNGALSYFRLVDAPEGSNRAYEGDWIVKHELGRAEVMQDHIFRDRYGLPDEPQADENKKTRPN